MLVNAKATWVGYGVSLCVELSQTYKSAFSYRPHTQCSVHYVLAFSPPSAPSHLMPINGHYYVFDFAHANQSLAKNGMLKP